MKEDKIAEVWQDLDKNSIMYSILLQDKDIDKLIDSILDIVPEGCDRETFDEVAPLEFVNGPVEVKINAMNRTDLGYQIEYASGSYFIVPLSDFFTVGTAAADISDAEYAEGTEERLPGGILMFAVSQEKLLVLLRDIIFDIYCDVLESDEYLDDEYHIELEDED